MDDAFHRRALTRLLAVVATALAGLLAVPPGPAAAVEGDLISIRLAEAPTSRADDPRARVYIVDHVAPGTRFTRDVEITNSTDVERVIDVYPGPAQITDGAWTVGDPGAESELTGWVTTGQGRLVLAPGDSRLVPVTVDVPPTASRSERYGVVWASTASDGDQQVQTVSRVGIRIYLSVGPGGEPATEFDITELVGRRTDDGALQAVATVENTGGRAIDLQGKLLLRDGPGGLKAGPFDAATRTTLPPGGTGEVVVDLDPTIPLGPWRARMQLASGTTTDSISAEITFPEETGTTRAEVEAGVPWWLWVLGLVVLVALALLWWLLALRRRRREGEPADPLAAAPTA